MISVYKKTIGEVLIFCGKILFFGLFWYNQGVYMGGDGVYFGVHMPLLEIILPWSGIGVLFVFFGMFLSRRQTLLSWQQFTVLLFLLILFLSQSLGSFAPNVSVLFLPLFIIAILTTVLEQQVSFFGKENLPWMIVGLSLGAVTQVFHPEFVINQVLALATIMFWITFASQGLFLQKHYLPLLFGCCLILWFSQSFLGMILFTLVLFSSKAWLPRSQKQSRKRHLSALGMVLLMSVGGFVLQQWDLGIFEKPAVSLSWSWNDMLTGVGQGQYLPTLQHYTSQFLIPEQLTLPRTGLMLWLREWGIIGVLFSSLLLIWNVKWGRMPGINLFVIASMCLLVPAFVTTEVGLLFWLILLLHRRTER